MNNVINFVKIGNLTINLDKVTRIREFGGDRDFVRVYYDHAVTGGYDNEQMVTDTDDVGGNGAALLLAILDDDDEEITRLYPLVNPSQESLDDGVEPEEPSYPQDELGMPLVEIE